MRDQDISATEVDADASADTELGDSTARPSRSARRSDPAIPGVAEGAMVHQYEIIRELGRGGMGRVVMARDTELGRRVAIKFLTATASPGIARRFLDEARTTAQLGHEHIVIVHEVNQHAGVPFMVLEYLEGEPLSRQVRDGGLPWPRALELVVPIVRALVHAHERGIMHRDMKPDNVVITRDGIVKVLDFGIAKAFATDGRMTARAIPTIDELGRHDVRLTADGAIVGTLPYMSPEQLGMDTVDARSDLWAVGVILWELIAGRHPLEPLTAGRLFESAAHLDEPMPRISDVVVDLPHAIERAIEACLEKRKERRIASATDLLALLEPLLPGRLGRLLADGESPYVGLSAFQEADATRFFGRSREIIRVVARLAEQPLVAIAGPSGVGKSSFVRAGVIPVLKASSERWETFVLRPGRDPFAALASLLAPVTSTRADAASKAAEHTALVTRLRTEPGHLGTILRARARQKAERILLFVDQFEELYTIVPSSDDRLAFASCLAAVADDSATPLRVILSIRSDFLDRVAESEPLVAEVTRGLVFLAPADSTGLRHALVQPLELAGYRFESASIVEDMLAALQVTPGALPLLQFVASRLWDARDRHHRLITVGAYHGMGGIAGALAAHADEAVAQMPSEAQRLARLMFQRLVTPDRTRAIVDVADLLALAPSPDEGQRVLDQLVKARLLIIQSRGEAEGPAIELVHESLITGWPRLRRWLDESQEEAGLVAQLGTAAKQWDASGRPAGLLWRGEAADEARRFAARTKRSLPERERAYLDAVIRLATRSTRIKRIAVGGVIIVLSVLVVAAVAALALIRDAERTAKREAEHAHTEQRRAEDEATRAKRAEDLANEASAKARVAQQESADRLREIQGKDEIVAKGKVDLQAANASLQKAVIAAEAARSSADEARRKAVDANAQLTRLLAEKDAELKKLKKANRPF